MVAVLRKANGGFMVSVKVLRYARPRFHRLFHPSPPDEHDDAFGSDPAGWLPMNMMTTLYLCSDPAMYTSHGRTYICASRCSRPRPYVDIRGRIFFLAPWPLYVRVHATCVPLLRHVRASTSTSMYVHVRDQNDNAMLSVGNDTYGITESLLWSRGTRS